MSDYSEYFLNGPIRVANLETLEISHPNFSQTYWVVRNSRLGLNAYLETGVLQAFVYYPIKVVRSDTDNSLDQVFRFSLGDLGEILPKELDRVNAANNRITRPIVKYRTYRSDDLSRPLLGPMRLEITDLPFSREGVAFEAKAPTLNLNQTGEYYDFSRFPGMRAFINGR